MRPNAFFRIAGNQKGVTAVVAALCMLVIMGFVALAIDLGYLYIVRGELQNAADSGALAGAQVLYVDEGTRVNQDANAVAQQYVQANYSEQSTVEVQSIERGHWSFSAGAFTPNDSLLPVDLWNSSTAQLDTNTDFINAVRVITKRKTEGGKNPAPFFASIFGIPGPNITAVAVAYIGFAGTLKPAAVDQPIAICFQSIVDEQGRYTCNTGRMLNSGSNAATHNTAAWANFSQPCQTANPPSVKPLICAGGNPYPIVLNQGMGATGGTDTTILKNLRNCFSPKTRTEPMKMTLPVIDCPDNNPGNCSKVVGAVMVNVVWISENDANTETKFQAEDFPPSRMGDWICPTGYKRTQCWDNFVQHFKLKNVDGITATYAQKSIYFLPDCEPHEPSGKTGGINTGILAEIPVLVN